MNWKYNNEIITGITDFPNGTFGFIYRLSHIPTGKAYIGKKVLFHNRKVKLTKKELKEYEGIVGRRPSYRIAVKESDWQNYWGSNKYLKELIKEEPLENFERQILICVPTKKLLTYYETKYLFVYQTLEKPDEFWNDNILGKFFTKDFI